MWTWLRKGRGQDAHAERAGEWESRLAAAEERAARAESEALELQGECERLNGELLLSRGLFDNMQYFGKNL